MGRAFAAALCLLAVAAAPAGAAQPECKGRGVPLSKISIQEFTFADTIGFGTGAAAQARVEEVIAFLSETGYRNIELYSLSGYSPEGMRALLREYGMKAPSRHVNVGSPESPVNIDALLAENKTIGIKYFGSGATPRYTTEAQWTAYAEYLDELGERARKAGQTLMIHNHDWEFETSFADTDAYEILLANTDPRNVVFQVDLHWAANGLGTAEGATSVSEADDLAADLVARLGNRAQLFHVKDMATGAFPGRIEILGRGGIDFPSIFAASKGPVRYYVVEHDPRFGDPSFRAEVAATEGFAYLTCATY
jgi:sugar phosphate isomerase/epimerase